MADWRLMGQERYLAGAQLSLRRYKAYREGWEHDHCAFCWAKFSEAEDDLNEGYATPDEYHWVCTRCYLDFKDKFEWTLV